MTDVKLNYVYYIAILKNDIFKTRYIWHEFSIFFILDFLKRAFSSTVKKSLIYPGMHQ